MRKVDEWRESCRAAFSRRPQPSSANGASRAPRTHRPVLPACSMPVPSAERHTSQRLSFERGRIEHLPDTLEQRIARERLLQHLELGTYLRERIARVPGDVE